MSTRYLHNDDLITAKTQVDLEKILNAPFFRVLDSPLSEEETRTLHSYLGSVNRIWLHSSQRYAVCVFDWSDIVTGYCCDIRISKTTYPISFAIPDGSGQSIFKEFNGESLNQSSSYTRWLMIYWRKLRVGGIKVGISSWFDNTPIVTGKLVLGDKRMRFENVGTVTPPCCHTVCVLAEY